MRLFRAIISLQLFLYIIRHKPRVTEKKKIVYLSGRLVCSTKSQFAPQK